MKFTGNIVQDLPVKFEQPEGIRPEQAQCIESLRPSTPPFTPQHVHSATTCHRGGTLSLGVSGPGGGRVVKGWPSEFTEALIRTFVNCFMEPLPASKTHTAAVLHIRCWLSA